MAKVWLITGTSSGLGAHFVTHLLSRGEKVIATARDLTKITPLKDLGAEALQWDVTSPQSELDALAAKAVEIYGHVDVLVNNAGYTQFGVLEEMRQEFPSL
jgi:NADP-dependent 3-hydroxy acid dehydrogenase YdfG